MISTSGLDKPITERLLTRSKISPTLSPARSAADPGVTSFTNGGTDLPSDAKSSKGMVENADEESYRSTLHTSLA